VGEGESAGHLHDERCPWAVTFRTFLFLTILLLVHIATLQPCCAVQGFISALFMSGYVAVIHAGFSLFIIVGGLHVACACWVRPNG
jgi:hypothetical protein